MATTTDYELVDYKAIAAVLRGMSLADVRAVAGAGWAGWWEDGEAGEPLQKALAAASGPLMFGRWSTAYAGDPDVSLDPDAEVVREGFARLALRYQLGCSKGLRLAFWQLVRVRFKAASTETGLAFFVESPVEPREPQGGFLVEELPLHFMGVS
jgi:hypothetical protein